MRGLEASNGTTNGARWSFKTTAIMEKLKENKGGVIMFADIDCLWLRPLAPLVWHYVQNMDMVFQRNDDFSLEANIGFMVMRANDRTLAFWEKVHEITMAEKMSKTTGKRPAIQGGDQRIANKLLLNPGLLDTPTDLKWSTLPSDVMTQVYQIDNNMQGSGYLHYWDYYLYHANKGGHHNASKGRSMKQDAIRRARIKLDDLGGIGFSNKLREFSEFGVWDE